MVSPKRVAVILGFAAMTLSGRAQFQFFRSPHDVRLSHGGDLRSAVEQANRVGGVNQIELGPGIYGLSRGSNQRAELVVKGNLTISCRQPGGCTIVGTEDRIFEILPGARLTLIGVTLEGGDGKAALVDSSTNSPQVEPGGAIYNQGSLTMVGCTVRRCRTGAVALEDRSAISGNGGAIANTGVLIMRDCVVLENTCGSRASYANRYMVSSGSGGGIYNSGTATLLRCTIDKNNADNANAPGTPTGNGGGICNIGRMILQYCNVQHNYCDNGVLGVGFAGKTGDGGGIYNVGDMVIDDSVIMQNTSGYGGSNTFEDTTAGDGGNGGGIFNVGTMNVTRTSISYNTAGTGGTGVSTGYKAGANGGIGGSGGGVYNTGTLNLTLCTFAYNGAGNGGYGGDEGFIGGPTDILPANLFGGTGGRGGNGGAIFNAGSVNGIACTIAFNYSGAGGLGGSVEAPDPSAETQMVPANGGNSGNGGGIFNVQNATASFANTMIDHNQILAAGSGGFVVSPTTQTESGLAGSRGVGPDCEGAIESRGFNLMSLDDGTGGFTNAMSTDLIGTAESQLPPSVKYRDYGNYYPTTLTLIPGSPGVDQGNSFGLKTDEVGHKRVVDHGNIGNAAGGDGADIGAVEAQ